VKILLVSETLETGGAETFVIRLANALALRHQVIVAVMHGDRIQPQLAEQLDGRVRLEACVYQANAGSGASTGSCGKRMWTPRSSAHCSAAGSAI
jgi:hypothetical protein